MSTTESPVENSGQEEEPKNRKRKISLSKYVHLTRFSNAMLTANILLIFRNGSNRIFLKKNPLRVKEICYNGTRNTPDSR